MAAVPQGKRAPPPVQAAKVNCTACGTTRALEFECIACCVKWLAGMDRPTMAANAPVIGAAAGQQQLEAVRQACRERMRQQ
jgi:hypothetical protein